MSGIKIRTHTIPDDDYGTVYVAVVLPSRAVAVHSQERKAIEAALEAHYGILQAPMALDDDRAIAKRLLDEFGVEPLDGGDVKATDDQVATWASFQYAGAIERAMADATDLTMEYVAASGATTSRVVTPLHWVKGRETFRAYCYKRHADRTFYVNRIKDLRLSVA
jgi:predicted DNA-binding transcriptional regulator YafY